MDFGIKTSIGIGSLILITSLTAGASQVFYSPSLCAPEHLTLFVTNKTNEPQRVWTQVRYGAEIDERHNDLEAKAQIKIRGTSFLPEAQAFSVKAWDKNVIQVTSSCDDSFSTPLTDTASPEVTHWLPSSVQSVKLHLLNLYLKPNAVRLKAFNRMGAVIGEKELKLEKYYDTSVFKWNLNQSIARIEVQGAERLHSVLSYDNGSSEQVSPPVALKPVTLPVDTTKTYFLVSTKDPQADEAFVIALDKPETIATAREQIRNPNLEKIVVAGIELGNGGFNRAFLSRDKAPYSWSVNRVDAFADFAHIDCDGSPELTEERLEQKLNEGGRICFWRYRVVRELTAGEVASGKLKP
ncbi:BP74-related protein [Bdellovibrio bacteriovorus]|uniref:BP74 N-terminal domain-containing protein n=1 Tax=Bdellovibrio bacteriovorus TaxID=959 RepID=A0A1Z3N8Q9_BDEBC|nr:hypothetical protein [Bdellovibrio bacteriovorus]ASD63836.1 hypothetical protein B9G79_09760 [Bdellovibrio bacteriovorus]